MEAAIKRCDFLYHIGHHIEALGTIVVFKEETSSEVQWRLARSIFKEAKNKESGPRHQSISEALKILAQNLELNPTCWNSHIWFAIIMGAKEDHDSFKQRITEAFMIRHHIDKCIELNPKSELGYHALGQWCYKVASVSWIQRKTAAALFSKLPTSTYEEAVGCFKKAEELCPDIFNENHVCLAQTYIDMGKKQLASEYLRKALQIPDDKKNDQDTLENIEEVEKLANKIGIKL